MAEPMNHERQTPEIQVKDQLRSNQRRQLLSRIKDDSVALMIGRLIPDSRPIDINPNLLGDLSELVVCLKENTHIVLFGLAATARNPQELSNISVLISQLDMTGKSDILTKSEDRFVSRRLPDQLNASVEVNYTVDTLLLPNNSKGVKNSEYMTGNKATPYLFESIFYVLSSKKIKPQDKRAILQMFYSMHREYIKQTRKIDSTLRKDASFWTNVDGSWIDPSLGSVIPVPRPEMYNQPQKPRIPYGNRPRTAVDEAMSLELEQQSSAALQDENTDLKYQLETAQQQLGSAKGEIERLKRRLNTAEQRAQAVVRAPEKSPFEVLGLDPTSTPEQITKTYHTIILDLNSDQVEGALRNTKLNPKTVAGIANLVKGRMQDVNIAMENLRRMGKVK